MQSVLNEDIFTVKFASKSQKVSLSHLLELLSQRESFEFPALQAHQRHGFYTFLVYLAALAISRSNLEIESDILTEISNYSKDNWKALLLNLTDQKQEPWYLINEDKTQPAFFQPPLLNGDYKKDPYITPDDIDILVLAKNHDVKKNKILYADWEHWLFALINNQTMNGFSGKSWYGIVRMNSGFGSRWGASFIKSHHFNDRFKQDLIRLLAVRNDLIEKYTYTNDAKYHLMWLVGRGDKNQIQLNECDPFFIEACRSYRLFTHPTTQKVYCLGVGSEQSILPSSTGNVGDFWLPIKQEKEKNKENLQSENDQKSSVHFVANTPSPSGFNYSFVSDLLNSNPISYAANQNQMKDNYLLLLEAMVRGQGQTNGYHEYIQPIASKSMSRGAKLDPKNPNSSLIYGFAKYQISYNAKAWSSLIRDMIENALKLTEDIKKVELDLSKFKKMFEQEIEAKFFEHLFSYFEYEDQLESDHDGMISFQTEKQKEWADFLYDLCAKYREIIIKSISLNPNFKFKILAKLELELPKYRGLFYKSFASPKNT